MASKDSVKGGIQELIQVVRAGNIIAEDNYLDRAAPDRALVNMSNVIVDINDAVQRMAVAMISDHMKALEGAREQGKYNEDILKALQGLKPTKAKEKDKDGDFSWLGLAGALVAGLVLGGIAFIASYVKGMWLVWKAMAKAIGLDTIIVKIFTWISEAFTAVKTFIGEGASKMWKAISGLFSESKLVKAAEEMWISIKSMFSENGIVKYIKDFFSKLGPELRKMFQWEDLMKDFQQLWVDFKAIFGSGEGSLIQKIKNIFGSGEGSMFGKMMTYFDDLFNFMKPITGFFKGLGAILGKLAVPLTVIMALWDTVSGALDGWNNTEGGFLEKFFGAMAGGLTGLVNSLIGGLLDLIKDGASWLLKQLGFGNAAAVLDSFSFSELFSRIIKGFFDFVHSMIDWVLLLFSNPGKAMEQAAAALGKLGDMAKNFLKAILRMVLPDPTSGLGKYAAMAIPDSVYEFAGLNPKTGQALAPAQAENNSAKGETMMAQADAAVSQGAAVINNAGKTIVNNATTALVGAKTTVTDSYDKWARGGYSMPWN